MRSNTSLLMVGSPPRRRGAADAGGGDVESRYAGAYEERVDPFREFIAGERSLRRRQLSAPDRIMFELKQVVSSSRCDCAWGACGLIRPALMYELGQVVLSQLGCRCGARVKYILPSYIAASQVACLRGLLHMACGPGLGRLGHFKYVRAHSQTRHAIIAWVWSGFG